MLPWERDIELSFIIKEVEQENLEAQTKAAQQRARGQVRPPMLKK